MVSPWPFSMWGMDVIRPITPKASNGHRFIFVVIDYFTKWVEAASYASVTKSVVARFIKREIIYRYGLSERIISDNGLNLNNDMITAICTRFKIKHHNSVPYRPKMNGAVEATNKNVKKIIHEIHESVCGTHASGHMMTRQILRVEYYWMTLESNCINYVRKCHKCQIYADKIHVSPTSLNVMVSP